MNDRVRCGPQPCDLSCSAVVFSDWAFFIYKNDWCSQIEKSENKNTCRSCFSRKSFLRTPRRKHPGSEKGKQKPWKTAAFQGFCNPLKELFRELFLYRMLVKSRFFCHLFEKVTKEPSLCHLTRSKIHFHRQTD